MTTGTPPPGAPAAGPPPPSALKQDDRLLAAAAHLSFLAGFWLIAPIAIYILKRKESRFVAFYALQAALLQILFGAGTFVLVVVCMVLSAAAGLSGHSEFAVVAGLIPAFGLFSGVLGILCVHAYAAFSAWQGRELMLPVAGHLAAAIMRADEGAAKQ